MNIPEEQTSPNAGKRQEILDELQNITDLPTLPTVFLKVMSMMRNPNIPMKEIATTLEADPAISVKLLRLINSSFYGLARKVDSVHQAIVLLGANTLKNVVISVSIFKSVGDQNEQTSFDRTAFWKHSIACGMVGRFLEDKLDLGRSEEGFIAGVIHDIGKIVLDRYFHPDLAAVMKAVDAENLTFHSAERKVLGITHTEIGAHLAEKWQLPEHLVAVIAQHHNIDPESEHAKLAAIVHLADITTRKFSFGSGGDDLIPKTDPSVWDVLDITEENLAEWNEDMEAEIDKSKEMLDALIQ
jgi:putative nucleotidyltransferase with HDIG domain